jgi:tetratricopeptide (TPR) repeat protein
MVAAARRIPLQIHRLEWLVRVSGFLLLMSGGIGLAADTSWQKAIETGDKLYEKGQYPQAEKAYQEALAETEEFGPEDPRLVSTENALALVCQALGKYSEAESLYVRVLATLEKTPIAGHLDVSIVANNLVELYRLLGRAEPLYQRALAISRPFANSCIRILEAQDTAEMFCHIQS